MAERYDADPQIYADLTRHRCGCRLTVRVKRRLHSSTGLNHSELCLGHLRKEFTMRSARLEAPQTQQKANQGQERGNSSSQKSSAAFKSWSRHARRGCSPPPKPGRRQRRRPSRRPARNRCPISPVWAWHHRRRHRRLRTGRTSSSMPLQIGERSPLIASLRRQRPTSRRRVP